MSKKRAESDSSKENLRRRILIPLGIGLVVLIATSVFSIHQTQHQQIHAEIDSHLAGVQELMASEYEAESVDMSILIDLLEADPALQTAWRDRDRQALLKLATPLFKDFADQERITHLYFIDTNRVCFLRVHRPESHDDTLARFTLERAVLTGEPTYGLELGEFGSLALRSVHPWILDGELVGYIELGQSIDHVMHHLHEIVDIELTVVVHKSLLDSASWTQGRRMFGQDEDWNRFENCVVISGTMKEVPNSLGQYMAADHSEHQHELFDMEHEGQPHMGRPLALLTADGSDIGDILVLKNVSAERASLKTLTFITIASGVVVGTLLFGLFYIILGRIERRLERTQNAWVSEISERKRVMEELAGRNDFLKNVFESLTHPFYVIDARTYRVLMGNTATGLTEPPTDITCHELTHHSATPCNDPQNICPLAEARRTKKPVTVEHIHYDSEGNERFVEVHGYPILDRSGEVVQLIEYTLDITERKRIEKELKESRAHSRMIIETASDAYIAINAEGVVTDWNRKAEKMFGWLYGEAVGQPLTELIIGPESANLHRKALAHCVRTGQGPILNKRIEVRAQHRNGLSFPIELTVWATRKNTCVQFNAFITDITERKLAEAEIRKFKTIADNATYGVAISGLDGKYIYTNESFARMHGHESDWFLGRQVFTTLADESRRKGAAVIRDLAEKGQVQPQEFWYRHKDGHKFPGLLSPVMIPDAHGKPAFVAAVLVDISEQKRAEEQLRDSEEQFRNLFEQSNDAIIVHTTDGRIIKANQRSSEMLGYNREELLSLPIQALHPDSERENFKQAFETIRKQGSAQFQSKFLRVDGSIIDVEVSSRVLDESHGIIQAVIRDISERVRWVNELRKLSAAVNQSANLICISNPDGIIEYVNPEFCRATEYSLDEAVGRQWNLLEPERSEDNLYGEIWTQISDGEAWSGNLRNRRKNGELFWARMTITPIFNDNQQIVNHLAVIEDITNEIAAQQGLAEADKLSAIGTLAAGVAHEFKNYLAGIMGNASFALAGLDDADGMVLARESLSHIVELSERANGVAMSLLTYSKAKPDEIGLEDLKSIIENSIRMVEKEIHNQSIVILTHFEDLPKVRVSASKIQQVLLNLIINARHAIDSDGIITVGLMRQGNQAVIKMSDTGKGIPAANFSKIFDPFFSTKGVWGKDAIAGTGMGLSICRNIAREHNGDLTVESVVGVGSTFIFSLPLLEPEDSMAESSMQRKEPLKIILFTTDDNMIADYQRQADTSGSDLRSIDNVDMIGDNINNVADVVICDAGITIREQLLRTLEVCQKFGVPYIVVNCENPDCRESTLGDNALSVHAGTPTLEVLCESLQLISARTKPPSPAIS